MTEPSSDFMNALALEMDEILHARKQQNKRGRGRPMTCNVKEMGNEYFRQYYHNHKDSYKCECGKIVKRLNKAKHLKTTLHANHLILQEELNII